MIAGSHVEMNYTKRKMDIQVNVKVCLQCGQHHLGPHCIDCDWYKALEHVASNPEEADFL